MPSFPVTRLTGAALLACAAASLAPQPARAQGEALQRAAVSRAKGAEDAPVLVFEIADFECPYCARFAREVFPALDSAYVRTGKVQWVFINMPLPMHSRAWIASEAAMCAGATAGRFWEMHDHLFARQAEWTTAADPGAQFLGYAREIGVPTAEFQACVHADVPAQLLLIDIMNAAKMVNGTPAFIIDQGEPVVGMKSFEELRDLIDRALERKQKRK